MQSRSDGSSGDVRSSNGGQFLFQMLGIRIPRLQTFDSLSKSASFRWLWLSNFFSQGAQWLQFLTVGWLVRDLTAGSVMSPLLVVLAGGIGFIPGVITGPFGGALGDRFDRRKLLIFIRSIMSIFSITFALLVGARLVSVIHVFVYAFISGIGKSIAFPTGMAMVPDTVPERLLGNAGASNVLTIPMTRAIGPFIGGILITYLGFFWNFALESVFYAASIGCLVFLKLPNRVSPKTRSKSSIIGDLVEGFKYVWKENRVLLYLTFVAIIPNTLLEPALYLLPVFTSEVLRRGADIGGYLMAINGVGGVTSAIFIISFGFVFPRGKIILVSAITSSVLLLLFSHSYVMPLAFMLIYLFAISQSSFRTTMVTLIQSMSIPEMRTRVISLQTYSMSFVLLTSLIIGWFAGFMTVSIALAALAAVGILGGLFMNAFQSQIKELK